jgi:hypothetical protein
VTDDRKRHVEAFYALLDGLADKACGPWLLRDCTGRDGWPSHGVYFFFEPGEERGSGRPRVVRVGTHALRGTSRATLWQRLAQHRGTRAGGGNHRGSIFRHHVGTALIARDENDAGLLTAWSTSSRTQEWTVAESGVEHRVSDYIGRMPFLWLSVPTNADGTSLRGYVERNSIALLSNAGHPVDLPSRGWLGRHAISSKVRKSGLWNVNHVEETYDPEFLGLMTTLVERTAKEGGHVA